MKLEPYTAEEVGLFKALSCAPSPLDLASNKLGFGSWAGLSEKSLSLTDPKPPDRASRY